MPSRYSSPTPLRVIQLRVSPGRKLLRNGMSAYWPPSETTVARIPWKVRLRTTSFGRGGVWGVRRPPVIGVRADGDRSGDVAHHQIAERDVLDSRPRAEAHLDDAAVGVVDHAVGNRDVLALAAAEPENRPARAERAVCHRDELVAAEQGARVVLAHHVAVHDVDVVAAVNMKSVVVQVD